MAPAPRSDSKAKPAPPPVSSRPKPRPRQKPVVSKPLKLALILTIGLLGCANLAALWALFSFTQGSASSPGLGRMSFLLPEASATPEPTALPTRVVIATPTFSPTASPTPGSPASPTPQPTPRPPSPLEPRPAAVTWPTASPPPAAPVAAEPEIQHVLIISIDGLRPDALFLAEAPRLDDLITRGAYSPDAQTISVSVTLPSHASMLSGMPPEKHGIKWGLPYIGWPGMNGPTLFSVAHDAGLSTAMIFGKDKLNYIAIPNSVDQIIGQDGVHDPEIKDQALKVIGAGLPHVLFIHFPDVDRVGHKYGWMSDNQLYAVAYVDGLIGEIVAELEQRGYLERTLLIITADHGGHGFDHGDDSPLDRTIPWLAVGPGVPAGLSLSQRIYTYDTAATAAYALDLPLPEIWDGRPVLEIFP